MTNPHTPADVLTLEADVASAGLALACSYSGSDEYEAAIIKARRAAGAFGPPWYQREIVWAGICLGAVLLMGILASITR